MSIKQSIIAFRDAHSGLTLRQIAKEGNFNLGTVRSVLGLEKAALAGKVVRERDQAEEKAKADELAARAPEWRGLEVMAPPGDLRPPPAPEQNRDVLPPVPPTVLEIPNRFWDLTKRTHAEAVEEIGRLAGILSTGATALGGLYSRVCDLIRKNNLTDREIRDTLSKHFPSSRVAEFIRVANAPPEVYRRYYGGFIGFKTALAECRGYQIHTDDELRKKKIRRAAERLIALLAEGEVTIKGVRVTVVQPKEIAIEAPEALG
jgi:hypothetical protein